MKIFIEIFALLHGGIKTSLLNFINNMSAENEIDLCVLKETDYLPNNLKNINIIKNDGFKFKINENRKSLSNSNFIKRLHFKVVRVLNQAKKYLNVVLHKKIKKEYDVAICYTGQYSDAKFVLTKVNAKKKIVMFHGDVVNVPFNKRQQRVYSKFDKICFVSKSCADIAKEKYVKLTSKIDYIYNMQDVNNIKKLSTEFDVKYNKSRINIVTVAVMSEEKAHIRMLNVFKKLKNEGYDFVWNLVGDGYLSQDVKRSIEENQMTNCVVMHGYYENPYPFIKNADLMLLCSYYEAAPMVFGEAMSLGTPVLSTKTRSAEELVGNFGFVCENSENGLYESLKKILSNKDLCQQKADKLKNYNYDNSAISSKFYDLISSKEN